MAIISYGVMCERKAVEVLENQITLQEKAKHLGRRGRYWFTTLSTTIAGILGSGKVKRGFEGFEVFGGRSSFFQNSGGNSRE